MLQRDFGHFDGRFLGVCVHAGDHATFSLVDDAIQGHRPNEDSIWATGSEDAGRKVALLTTLAHETRHFHDYLLSPFGAASFRERFLAQYLTKELLVAWHAAGIFEQATCLPVPIPRWLRLDASHRRDFIERLNAFYSGQAVLWPPDFGPELEGSLNEVALEIAERYKRVWELWETPEKIRPLGVTPTHVWETSAFLVQLAEADRLYTARGRSCLAEYVVGDVANTYARSIRILRAALGELEEKVALDLMGVMVTWALLGDERDPSDLASPSTRYLLLANLLKSKGVPSKEKGYDVLGLFAEWDKALRCPPVEDALRWSLERDERFAESLARDSGPAAKRFRIYAATRRRCVELFLPAPHTYVAPYSYLQMAGTALPRAPLLIKVSNAPWWNEAEQMSFTTYATAGDAVLTSPLQSWSEGEVDIRFAEELLRDCAMADILFCEYRDMIDGFDEDTVRSIFERCMRLLFVPRHLAK